MTDIGDLNFKERLKKIKAFVFDVDGVLSDSKVSILPDGKLGRTTNVKDGYAIVRAIEEGFIIGIITGGNSDSVANRFREIGIESIYIASKDKVADFENFITKYKIAPEEVLYMGDDLPDMKVMKRCGVATCPADAVEDIKGVSLYISGLRGGDGCVRDIIAQVMKTQNKWYK